jgi:hypothetical protein
MTLYLPEQIAVNGIHRLKLTDFAQYGGVCHLQTPNSIRRGIPLKADRR